METGGPRLSVRGTIGNVREPSCSITIVRMLHDARPTIVCPVNSSWTSGERAREWAVNLWWCTRPMAPVRQAGDQPMG